MQDLFGLSSKLSDANDQSSGCQCGDGSRRPIGRSRKRWRSFDEARAWVRDQGFRNVAEYRAARVAKRVPVDIPSAPNLVYKGQGWSGYKDFLGFDLASSKRLEALDSRPARIGSVSPVRRGQKKVWRCFDDAREWARSRKFANVGEFHAASKAGLLPKDIPSHPNITYKDFGWVGMSDFLGIDNSYWPFESARAWAHAQRDAGNVFFAKDWARLRAGGVIPARIPGNPNKVYAGKGWISWEDFLGKTDNRRSKLERRIAAVLSNFTKVSHGHVALTKSDGRKKRVDIYLPEINTVIEVDGCYWHCGTQQKDIADTKGLTDAGYRVVRIREQSTGYQLPLINSELDLALSSKLRVEDKVSLIIEHLARINVLPTISIENINNLIAISVAPTGYSPAPWLPFGRAREIARSLGLSSKVAWNRFIDSEVFSESRFERMPKAPWAVYPEWISMGDWLGTDNLAPSDYLFVTYEQAKRLVQTMFPVPRTESQWRKAIKAGSIPDGVPLNPYGHYGKAFLGWGDFLGTGNKKHQRKQYVSIDEAMKWVAENLPWPRTFNIWAKAVKDGLVPKEIPRSPASVYQVRGEWVDWKTFLGTGRKRHARASERPLPPA